jgi:hypothetical protein
MMTLTVRRRSEDPSALRDFFGKFIRLRGGFEAVYKYSNTCEVESR